MKNKNLKNKNLVFRSTKVGMETILILTLMLLMILGMKSFLMPVSIMIFKNLIQSEEAPDI